MAREKRRCPGWSCEAHPHVVAVKIQGVPAEAAKEGPRGGRKPRRVGLGKGSQGKEAESFGKVGESRGNALRGQKDEDGTSGLKLLIQSWGLLVVGLGNTVCGK